MLFMSEWKIYSLDQSQKVRSICHSREKLPQVVPKMSSRRDRIFNLIQRFNVAADNAMGSLRNESTVPLVDRYVGIYIWSLEKLPFINVN